MKHDEMENEESNQRRVSGTRRTRSQAAPEWSTKGSLILVNEIAAVEADCSNALSSYQKWNIIAENCTVLDVVARSLNQCRRKWDSLLAEYKKIKQWELKSRRDSYWSLGSERRRKFGLPEDFDNELFKAVDDFVSSGENQSDTDPDSDPEANAEMLHLIAQLGSKRQRRQLTSQKSCAEEKPLKSHPEEGPLKSLTGEKSRRSCVKETPQRSRLEEDPVKSPTEEKPQKGRGKEKCQRSCVEEKETRSIDEMEQMMVMKLHENAEMINAIVSENADFGAADVQNVENLRTDFARRQGDKLIACLTNIVKTLGQLHDLDQECE